MRPSLSNFLFNLAETSIGRALVDVPTIINDFEVDVEASLPAKPKTDPDTKPPVNNCGSSKKSDS